MMGDASLRNSVRQLCDGGNDGLQDLQGRSERSQKSKIATLKVRDSKCLSTGSEHVMSARKRGE